MVLSREPSRDTGMGAVVTLADPRQYGALPLQEHRAQHVRQIGKHKVGLAGRHAAADVHPNRGRVMAVLVGSTVQIVAPAPR